MNVKNIAKFERLADGLGVGPVPDGWAAIVDLPILILVGVTGVGKSTTVEALGRQWGHIALLPDRRQIADLLVIPTVQGWDEDPLTRVIDRRQRFTYTARYRQRYPGGLAHAFSRLVLQRQPDAWPGRLIFDGLRGADEVAFATESLPLARFAVLHAPDVVRTERLLQRQDPFDHFSAVETVQDRTAYRPLPTNHSSSRILYHIQSQEPNKLHPDLAPQQEGSFGEASFDWGRVPEGHDLFNREEKARLAALVGRGEVAGTELAAKIAIVAAERRNYDPDAAVEVLQYQAPERMVVIDTTTHSPAEAAAVISGQYSGTCVE